MREIDMLEAVRNVAFDVNQKVSRESDNALIRPATSGRREFGDSGLRDVYTNYGKITVIKFPDIRTTRATRATRATRGLCSIGMRIRADALREHAKLLLL
jgi:hypothetical protein